MIYICIYACMYVREKDISTIFNIYIYIMLYYYYILLYLFLLILYNNFLIIYYYLIILYQIFKINYTHVRAYKYDKIENEQI